MSHSEKKKLISQEQHGFLPGKFCCTNLLEFMEKVTSAVDEGVPYDVIFLDFAKAFGKRYSLASCKSVFWAQYSS
jgi:hypothetical protein